MAVDSGVTLREAITSIDNAADVNSDVTSARSGAYGSVDTIAFAVGSGAHTIAPTRALPALIRDVVVDGTTQPGFVGVPLVTVDGSGAGAFCSGLLVHASTNSTISALAVQMFAESGVRIGTTVDRIAADGFEGAPPPSPTGSGTISLNNVSFVQNGGTGVQVEVGGVLVNAQDLVVATNGAGGILVGGGRVNVSGASQINGNTGGAPIAFGAQVLPGATLTLTGAQGAPIEVDSNAGVGLLLRGNFSGLYVEVANNETQGVWVDTTDPPLFPEGGVAVRSTELAAFDVAANGWNPGAFPGGGITVLRTRASTTSMSKLSNTYQPERFVLMQGPAIQTQSSVHDNAGDGVTLGGDPTPSTGLCANLPSGLTCGAVDANIRSSYIVSNWQGVVVREQDADQNATVFTLSQNHITVNIGLGFHAYTSYVGMDEFGARINGNLIGHNGWPNQTCQSPPYEVAAQIEFEGPVAATAEAAAGCAAHDDTQETECNADFVNACIFNLAAPANKCKPSWSMSAISCGSATSNTITGYDRSGIENEDLRVGIVAKDGAYVGAINASFLTASFAVGEDWVPVSTSSFAGNAGTVCPAAINKCPQ